MFSQATIEKIEYYVYFLQDPITGNIFYVGKGNGNRVFDHMDCAIETDGETEKLDIIRKIIRSGMKPKHYILRHGLSEKTAFEIEASVIDFVGVKNLSNIQIGHYSRDFGIKTAEEISAIYEAEELSTNRPIILININRLYRREMTETELYDATRQSWVLGSRKDKAEYALATYRGLTREVYCIQNWFPVKVDMKTRWDFNGAVANKEIRDKLIYKSISNLFRKGSANPIKYINC